MQKKRNAILIVNIALGLRIPSGDYPLGLLTMRLRFAGYLTHGRDIKTNEV